MCKYIIEPFVAFSVEPCGSIHLQLPEELKLNDLPHRPRQEKYIKQNSSVKLYFKSKKPQKTCKLRDENALFSCRSDANENFASSDNLIQI